MTAALAITTSELHNMTTASTNMMSITMSDAGSRAECSQEWDRQQHG
jgi:hypothetical protein